MIGSCDYCFAKNVFKRVPAVHWDHSTHRSIRSVGNSLCVTCYNRLKHDIAEFRPRPMYSKPTTFIVASIKTDTIMGENAITLCICFGNWIKASQIRHKALAGGRFKVTDLKNLAYGEKKTTVEGAKTAIQSCENPKLIKADDSQDWKSSNECSYKSLNGYAQCPRCKQWKALTIKKTLRRHVCEKLLASSKPHVPQFRQYP